MNAPVIEELNFASYCGVVGDTISIAAYDDFRVRQVDVIIQDGSKGIVESGCAIVSETNPKLFVFTCTVRNIDYLSSSVSILVTDYAGNAVGCETKVAE